jgi:hypothetical protein
MLSKIVIDYRSMMADQLNYHQFLDRNWDYLIGNGMKLFNKQDSVNKIKSILSVTSKDDINWLMQSRASLNSVIEKNISEEFWEDPQRKYATCNGIYNGFYGLTQNLLVLNRLSKKGNIEKIKLLFGKMSSFQEAIISYVIFRFVESANKVEVNFECNGSLVELEKHQDKDWFLNSIVNPDYLNYEGGDFKNVFLVRGVKNIEYWKDVIGEKHPLVVQDEKWNAPRLNFSYDRLIVERFIKNFDEIRNSNDCVNTIFENSIFCYSKALAEAINIGSSNLNFLKKHGPKFYLPFLGIFDVLLLEVFAKKNSFEIEYLPHSFSNNTQTIMDPEWKIHCFFNNFPNGMDRKKVKLHKICHYYHQHQAVFFNLFGRCKKYVKSILHRLRLRHDYIEEKKDKIKTIKSCNMMGFIHNSDINVFEVYNDPSLVSRVLCLIRDNVINCDKKKKMLVRTKPGYGFQAHIKNEILKIGEEWYLDDFLELKEFCSKCSLVIYLQPSSAVLECVIYGLPVIGVKFNESYSFMEDYVRLPNEVFPVLNLDKYEDSPNLFDQKYLDGIFKKQQEYINGKFVL